MTIHLNVSDELEARLRHRATALGTTIESVATELLSAGVARDSRYLTGRQLIDAWESDGVIGYRTEIEDSAGHARAIRDKAERRNG